VKEFLDYLDNELDKIVAQRLAYFKLEADSVTICTTLLKSSLVSQLDGYKASTLNDFETSVKKFKATQDDCTIRVDNARRKLTDSTDKQKRSTLLLLAAVVEDSNRETLNKYANPVLAGVVDNILNTAAKLQTAIQKAKTSYFGEAYGQKDEQETVGVPFHLLNIFLTHTRLGRLSTKRQISSIKISS
jgi:hypothetical protein